MEAFNEFLGSIDHHEHRERTKEVMGWVVENFPSLCPELKWNQPMFTDHGTYIIGFSVSKKHLAIAPERAGIIKFADEIKEAGYDHTKQLIRIPWESTINFSLLKKMIEFNMADKADCSTFWR
ncbi:iron chaperone [Jeotgalibacillus proteolyticus]|uniref:Iron chaperone n=1 Tax=Jeotgalibacillus proteolyticus TaxID=2082395 RepID=A0A2S5GDH6_9BACL|nr:iron chaperone [Jeotgalibacillus proteolyticus]PPA71092.1 iron chaperone [Jeotgalibacillus proteolyticus]